MLTISSIAVAPMPQATPPVARAQPAAAVRPSNAVAREETGAGVTPQGEVARVQAQGAPSPLAPVTPPQEGQRADILNNAAAPERSGLPPPAGADGQRRADGVPRPGAAGASDQGGAAARAADAGVVADAPGGAQQPVGESGRSSRAAPDEVAADLAAQRDAARRAETAAGPRGREEADASAITVKNPALEALETQIKELLPNMWKASRAAVDMMIGEEARAAAQERAKRLEELQTRLLAKPLAALPPEEAAQTYSATQQGEPPAVAGTRIDRLA